MAKACFIGIDQGSSATKTLAVDGAGQVLTVSRRKLGPPFRDHDHVEQDPGEIVQSIRESLRETIGYAQSAGFTVQGAGLSCQRSSCLVWDQETGKPLSPVLSWRDLRGAALVRGLAPEGPRVFARTGLPLTPYYSAAKFRWLRENVPAAEPSPAVFGTLSSFQVRMLTGAHQDRIDHANAQRTQLLNVRTLAWDPEQLALFGLSGVTLPAPTPTCTEFGEIVLLRPHIPLLACTGDQQAALFGLGVLEPGDGGINYGTGGFLLAPTGNDPPDVPGLMRSVFFTTPCSRSDAIEGSVNAVGDALAWLRDRFGFFSDLTTVDALCSQAQGDAVAFLGLNGIGAPYWEEDCSTAFAGLSAESGPAEIVRAVVEGIAFFLRDIADRIAAAGLAPARYTVSGGLANLKALVRAQANILGRELRISSEQEASALGAAFLAGMQYGAWTPATLRAMTRHNEIVMPQADPGLERRHRRWRTLHQAVRELDAQ